MECTYQLFYLLSEHSRKAPSSPDKVGVLGDWKEFVQKESGRHCTQEQTACLVSETTVGKFPIIYFRGISVAAGNLVRYGSTDRIGRVWGYRERTRADPEAKTQPHLTSTSHDYDKRQ
jgi:hypothetical protein